MQKRTMQWYYGETVMYKEELISRSYEATDSVTITVPSNDVAIFTFIFSSKNILSYFPIHAHHWKHFTISYMNLQMHYDCELCSLYSLTYILAVRE
jgi:hypothetical protein